MPEFVEWAWTLIAVSFIPQTFYSILFERKTVKRGAALIYGLSYLGFAFGLWYFGISHLYVTYIRRLLTVWSVITILVAFNYPNEIPTLFSYRNPASLELSLLIYLYLLPEFMKNIQWLILITTAFLAIFNSVSYALSR